MGQEIDTSRFNSNDFERYHKRLRQETELLNVWISNCKMSNHGPVAGFELEAWLVDKELNPAAINGVFLEKMGEPLVFPELAQFNIELNHPPKPLIGDVFSDLEERITSIWNQARTVAEDLDAHLMMIGILPTVTEAHLDLHHMSPLKRYRALNEQVLRSRHGRPLQLDIVGKQHLRSTHFDLMLESATTSFQIHLQVPSKRAHKIYNAAIVASAPMVAVGANSPYLFCHDLWDETRIPLFEQAVEIGGFNGVAQGPLRRVSFGSDYARESIIECFKENLQHFPILLPINFDDDADKFSHLRLHNGTIWRWNRPLIGFDNDGTPHIRIEHRILPGSPSIKDAIANAALFYGMSEGLCMDPQKLSKALPFAQAKDNFYQAARFGLNAHITWFNRQKINVRHLILGELLPLAQQSLLRLGVETHASEPYLNIIKKRLECNQNGCNWQRQFIARNGTDMHALTAAYLENQQTGAPVHQWSV